MIQVNTACFYLTSSIVHLNHQECIVMGTFLWGPWTKLEQEQQSEQKCLPKI